MLKEIVSNLITGVQDIVGERLKHMVYNRILEYQTSQYKRNTQAKTLIHRSTPALLSRFYQPLFLEQFGVDPEVSRISTASVTSIFTNTKCVTILGEAGSGKSTLVQYLLTRCVDEGFKIPVKIELRYLSDYENGLVAFVKEEIFAFHQISEQERISERLLNSGEFLFFFDGYDEIPFAKREIVAREIDEMVGRYNNNYFLLTCRPHAGAAFMPGFQNFQISHLQKEEIDAFIHKQVDPEERELADKIVATTNRPETKPYRSFLQNPLLLSMFILTFRSYADIPKKKSVFYRQVFEALFSVHDHFNKKAYSRIKESGLGKEEFETTLRSFCFLSFFGQRYFFSRDELERILNALKQKRSTIVFENEQFIKDLLVSVGILNQDNVFYTFVHRSLQEYFVALHISLQNQNNKVRIYRGMLSLIEGELHQLREWSGLYELLVELDKEALLTYCVLPFLRQALVNMKCIDQIDSYEDYLKLARFFYLIDLFPSRSSFMQLRKDWSRFINSYAELSSLAKVRQSQQRVEVILRAAQEHLQLTIRPLARIIQEQISIYEDILLREERNDEDLIDMVETEMFQL